MQRQVKDRKTKEGAEKLAKKIKGQLKRGEVGRVHRAPTEEQALLELCRKLRDPKAILQETLDCQDNFKRATVAACCDRYIEEYRDRDSSMTRNDATGKAGPIRETLGECYLDSLTERDIEEWREIRLKGSNRYRNNIHAHLRHLFGRARVWGFVPKGHNPARDVPSLKVPRTEPVVWSPTDLKACLDWCHSTGIPKILRVMKSNGSPPPEFEFDDDHSYFLVRLPVHPKEKSAPRQREATTQVTTQVEALLRAIEGEKSREEIQEKLNLANREHFRKGYLVPALESGLIERTIPDKPNSRLQKYRLTEQGAAFSRQ